MAISAQRLKVLDLETNIPVLDFTKLTNNNEVFGLVDDLNAFVPDAMSKLNGLMDKLTNGIKGLEASLKNAVKGLVDKIKGLVSSIIDMIPKLGLPSFIKDIFNLIMSMDKMGVSNFLKDALNVGSMSLCNNRDFLGVAGGAALLSNDILSGVLIALVISWVDRKCKNLSKEEQASMSSKEIVETIVPYAGETVTQNTMFPTGVGLFKSYTDYMTALSGTIPTQLTTAEFMTEVLAGNVDQVIYNLAVNELSYSEKQTYVQAVSSAIFNATYGTPEYDRLNDAWSKLQTLSPISPTRKTANVAFSNVTDTIGRNLRNLIKAYNSFSIPKIGLSAVELGLLAKIEQLIGSAKYSYDFMGRDSSSGSYLTFDFSTIFPPLTSEELIYLGFVKPDPSVYKFNNISPTTEVYFV